MSEEDRSMVYRTKSRLVPILFALMFVPITVACSIYGAQTESLPTALGILACFGGFTGLMLFSLVRTYADIEINKLGLRKVYFGQTIQWMSWPDVDHLFISKGLGQETFQPVRWFTVAAKRQRPKECACLIQITERRDMQDLICELMKQIANHGIRIIDGTGTKL